jgi:hypothetical protein
LLPDPIQAAFRHLLRPLVRILLRNGVTWREFSNLSKEIFVDVARADYGIDGRPTNDSRVALMTGLSRHEVGKIKRRIVADRPTDTVPGRISQLLTAWHVEREFLAADGSPAVLPVEGEGASVETLLKRHAGDMPHGAVMKELERLDLVERDGDRLRVKSRDYIRSSTDPDLIRQAGVALHDHAATIAHNVDMARKEPPRLERMATSRSLPRRHERVFRGLLDSEARKFLETIDRWLTAHSVPGTERGTATSQEPTFRTGVGVFFIHDERD